MCNKPSFYLHPTRLAALGRSDHAGFFIRSSDDSRHTSSKKVKTRDFRKKNHDIFLFLLHQVDWSVILDFNSLDLAISVFNDLVCHLFDLCFPVRVVRMRTNDPPWMTPFLKFLFDRMDNAFFRSHSRISFFEKNIFAKSLALK